jgi:hypothetical protein
LPEGHVLVLDFVARTPHYRDPGGVHPTARVAAGTLESVTLAAGARATDLHAFAILVALVTLAPMLAAAAAGLVI